MDDVPGIGGTDLDGRWFDLSAYSFDSISASNYVINADGSSSTAPEATDVAGVEITLDDDGDFIRTGF